MEMIAKLFKFCTSEFIIDRDSCNFVDYVFAMTFQTKRVFKLYSKTKSNNYRDISQLYPSIPVDQLPRLSMLN